jgi:hypothetical protein
MELVLDIDNNSPACLLINDPQLSFGAVSAEIEEPILSDSDIRYSMYPEPIVSSIVKRNSPEALVG